MIDYQEIATYITQLIGEQHLLRQEPNAFPPCFVIHAEQLLELCSKLRENYFFDHLNCITAIDNGQKAGTIDIVYHLTALTKSTTIALKITIPRGNPPQVMPQAPSLTPLWRTADWHEREAYDLFGIQFVGHPDLRRILLPADWHGFPLRKDYTEQETYHGVKIKY
ncbi:MAG: NADH-quinone oxidoreductase subunit C [Cytophagales bacterium]|nr:NADH-quinone oxidoreductase subunit C [Bernardetiaceae bacterium]MDW8205155.1 NADH-quinone oxidoreductase subunit C [Cytophagales bacterium]